VIVLTVNILFENIIPSTFPSIEDQDVQEVILPFVLRGEKCI